MHTVALRIASHPGHEHTTRRPASSESFRDPRNRGVEADGQLDIFQLAELSNPELLELLGQRLAIGPGWKGRRHRVLGGIHWSQAHTAAVAAFETGRAEAEQHGAAGERAMMQVRLVLAVSLADLVRADDELALAHQILDGLDQP